VQVQVETTQTEMRVTASLLDRWFCMPGEGALRGRPTYAQHLTRPTDAGPPLTADELLAYLGLLERTCLNQSVSWSSSTAFLIAEA
jgi:hypothetical protein